MQDQEWKDYIKQRLKEKASPETIINELEKEGLTKQQILSLIQDQKKSPEKPAKKPKTKKFFLTAIAIIIILAIIVYGVMLYQKNQVLANFENYQDYRVTTPQQEDTTEQPFTKIFNNQEYLLTPKASYKTTIMIGGTKKYNDDAGFAEYDMVFLWGKLANPYFENHLQIDQRERQWFSEFTETGPYNCSYIAQHGANTHMIPANEQIRQQLEKITKKEIVSFEGLLVDAETTLGDTKKEWKTSLTRTDAGLESCEIFYVETIEILD